MMGRCNGAVYVNAFRDVFVVVDFAQANEFEEIVRRSKGIRKKDDLVRNMCKRILSERITIEPNNVDSFTCFV